jgi:outer membrane lipoprotein carrier protein
VGLSAALLAALARAEAADEAATPTPGAESADESAPTEAPDACATRTAALIQRRYENVRDLRARFEQTTRPAGAAAATTSRGTVVLAKPGKMRWSYEAPEPSLVVSDGTTLWVYDPAFREAQRLPVSEGYLSGAAIQFLLGEGDIFRAFRVEAVACEEKRAELELVPREPSSYEKIGVVVDPATGDLTRTRLVDLLGTAIEVELSELEVNQSPPASLFRFEAPEGVRVMDLQP